MSLCLHLGCGNVHKLGFVNIDHRRTPATDRVENCCILASFGSDTVDLIETYHLIEHLPRPDGGIINVRQALVMWYNVLKSKGKLVIECPDFEQVIREYIQGNKSRKDNIFGLDRFEGDTHRWGYGFEDLKELLEFTGFKNIVRKEPTDYHKDLEPCMHVEAMKP